MSHSAEATVSPQALAEVNTAYAALRALITTDTSDRTALCQARERYATAAQHVADQTTGFRRRLWLNHATRARRELREVHGDAA